MPDEVLIRDVLNYTLSLRSALETSEVGELRIWIDDPSLAAVREWKPLRDWLGSVFKHDFGLMIVFVKSWHVAHCTVWYGASN